MMRFVAGFVMALILSILNLFAGIDVVIIVGLSMLIGDNIVREVKEEEND